ncbi:hypothetical protein HY627_00605 [Candidatus Uhrbacteria bacterium]|nr:hypothetical protein [Candidatus Uhrbacteria bacterium]
MCEKKQLEFLLDRELARDLSSYVKKLKALRVWGWIPVLIEGVATPVASTHAMVLLQNDLPHKDTAALNEFFSLATTPDEVSLIQSARIETLELACAMGARIPSFSRAKDPERFLNQLPTKLRARIRSHIKKFRWTTFNYEGPAFNAELLQRTFQGMAPAKARAEIREIKKRAAENRKKKRALLKSLPLEKETRTILSLLCESMLMKEYRKIAYQQSYAMMEGHIREASRRVGIRADECKFLSPGEIADALKHPQRFVRAARSRRTYCVIVITPGKTVWFEGKAAEKKVSQLTLSPLEAKAAFLKGQVAYPGSAEGAARIVLTTKDLLKMKKGDILVSSATNPDLLPGMKIAGAIVTDVGGIISHAAIVSRELQIPCVVGTKSATKVFKDGDRVRVDAKQGIVTKL